MEITEAPRKMATEKPFAPDATMPIKLPFVFTTVLVDDEIIPIKTGLPDVTMVTVKLVISVKAALAEEFVWRAFAVEIATPPAATEVPVARVRLAATGFAPVEVIETPIAFAPVDVIPTPMLS